MNFHFSQTRVAPAKSRRARALVSGAALLAVVAPGLARTQMARAQGAFPQLPATTSMPVSARANVAPTATNKLTPVPFQAPTPRAIRVSKINAAKAFPYVNRAAKQLAAGQTAQALSSYRQAYQLDPANEYAAPGVGTSLLIQGKFAESAQTFRNHLVTNPGDAKSLRGLADSLTYARKYREALGVNNYILARAPRDFDALFQNAQIATYAGDYKLSETYFSRASGVDKSNRRFLGELGRVAILPAQSTRAQRFQSRLTTQARFRARQPGHRQLLRLYLAIWQSRRAVADRFGRATEQRRGADWSGQRAFLYRSAARSRARITKRRWRLNPTIWARVWVWGAPWFSRAATSRARPSCAAFWRLSRTIARLWKPSLSHKTRRRPRRRFQPIKRC